MSKTKGPSIVSQIVERLYADGPLRVTDMCKTIKYSYKSVYTKALELRTLGLADKDNDGVWSLREGVTPQTLETGELAEVEALGAEEEVTPPGKKIAPILRGPGTPLDQKNMFIQELTNVGVTPKECIPTIASIFFSGDIDKLRWLEQVLKHDAAGYVTAHQRRLIISFWSNTRGLPYDPDEFFPDVEDEGKLKKAGAKGEKAEAKPEKRLDPDIGWKIEKDKDSEWVAIPGGPMSYLEAVEAARDRQVIAAYAKKEPSGESEGEGEIEEGSPARKGSKRQESLVEYLMKKMVDNMLDGSQGKAAGDSETVRILTERIDNMEKDRTEERFECMEGMLANIAARDPWEDYDRIEQMKQRLGGGGPVVTDQSPAVQLIKDTTDKMDKNMARLVGIMERAALRSEEFRPEETRTPKERDSKATELLGEVQSREHSRSLRRNAFGF